MRHTAIVIIQDEMRRLCLQLRDDKPYIQSPNCWSMFGGACEADEPPRAAAVREIEEELCVRMQEKRLTHFKSPYYPELARTRHVFHYWISEAEKPLLKLMEGQRYAFVAPDAVELGRVDGINMDEVHRGLLLEFLHQPAQ